MIKKWKKAICIAAAISIAAVSMVGCGKGRTGKGELIYYVVGVEKADTATILQQVNERVKEKTGQTVKFEILTQDNYDLALSSGDDYDLIYAPDWLNYWENTAKGAFAEITDDEIKENIPYYWENGQDMMDVTKYKGIRYGIANIHNYAPDRCFAARGDLMDKYGIKSLDNMEDVEKYLTAVAENETEIIPFDVPGSSPWLMLALFATDWGWAPVGSLSYGEHVYYKLDDPEHKLFIAAERPEMLEFTETMKRWNEKGFFSNSVLSNKTTSEDSLKAGRSALAFVDSPQQCQNMWQELSKDERAAWDVRFYSRLSKQQQMYGWTNGIVAVSAFSNKKPEALKVINAMYEDPQLQRLLNYGIEGVHYTVNSDNKLSFTENYESSGYTQTGIYTDEFAYDPELDFPGADELTKKLKDIRVVNPAVNCPLSDDGIREIKLALSEIYSRYSSPRCYGVMSGSPKETLDAEIAALKNAGIDQYKEAIQIQLDEYLEGISK